MDRVRFGRVLGKGARLAARTALEAVDAATAIAPAGSRTPEVQQGYSPTKPTGPTQTRKVSLPVNLLPAVRTARAGVLAPLKQASRALWHELTGSFFALFALSFSVGVWRTRTNAWSSVPADRHRFAAFCLLALLFLYFTISSCARARKRPPIKVSEG